jgi:DNA replication protein DnaC
MARRQPARPQPTPHPAPQPAPADLRERILADFAALKVPLSAEQFDAVLAGAQREGLSHQQFLHRLIAEQADRRRERSIAHRIREARFRERQPLATFDWEFNRQAIDRTQIEELASGAFIARRDNLVFVGQSGVGKSFLIQALAEAACVLGYSVRYTTSADLLIDLTASLADQTLPERLRHYARFDLLVIDEFGFEKIERSNSPQAANLLYKIIDARTRQRSTALVTNIDFEAWGDYLGDAPLAMAFLDRVVDGAIILKINGKSYRAHRANSPKPGSSSKR